MLLPPKAASADNTFTMQSKSIVEYMSHHYVKEHSEFGCRDAMKVRKMFKTTSQNYVMVQWTLIVVIFTCHRDTGCLG